MDFGTVLSNLVTHVYIFPAVETVRGVVAANLIEKLLRHRHVTRPVNPALLRRNLVRSFTELLVAVVTVHTRVRSVRELVQVNTNHAVLTGSLMVLEVVRNVVGVGLQVVITTDEDIRISRTVTSIQRCHATAVLLKDDLGQVQLAFCNVAVKHSFAVINIAVEDHDDLEVLLGLGGKRIQRVVQNICTTARGDNDRSLVTVSRHAFPSG